MGLKIGDWDCGLEMDWRLGLGIGIRDWNWGLGVRIGDWDWELGFRIGD